MAKRDRIIAAMRVDRATMRIVPAMTRAIRAEKNRAIDEQLAYYRNTVSFSKDIEAKHAQNIKAIIKKFIRPVMRDSVKITNETVQSSMKANIQAYEIKRAPLFDEYLGEWVENESATRIIGIAATTFSDIKRLMRKAFYEGAPANVVIKEGLKAKGFSAARAALIARTETHAAAQYAARQTSVSLASEVGVTLKKEWIPVNDERTRPDHMAMMNSPAIGVDEDFIVGGERMDRPADPTASPEQTINCRCQVVFVPDF